MRGSRVQAVVNELQGEKIDIIKWNPDIATFIINSLAPAEVSKVVLDEEIERIEVVVPDEHLSLAIGRKGQNVRLACQLTGWDIDILTEATESERRQSEFVERSNIFIEALDVDEVIAQLLVSEGFTSIEDLTYVEIKEIIDIDGFDEDTAIEIQQRARTYLDERTITQDKKRIKIGVSDDLLSIDGLTTDMLVKLGENGIKSLDDFAGSITDDLTGWVEKNEDGNKKYPGIFSSFSINAQQAEKMIMDARVKAGWITEEDLNKNEKVNIIIDDEKEKAIVKATKLKNARILK